jgi:tetratricopeptide (TPR) repeat protein
MATLEEATLRDRLASEAEQKSIANRTAAAKATQLMVEAQALEAQGAWKDAIARYRDAVSAIDASTPDFPEAPAIRATLQAALSEVQARHANAEREAIAAREAQDEAERIAKLRVTMSGGAWLVTQAGRSEPIRGLHIVVAIRPVANSRTSDLWKAVAAESEGRVAEGIASLEEAKKQRDQMMEQLKGSSGSYVTRVTEDTAKLIGLLEQSLELKSNQLADAKERMEDALRAESTEWIMLDELFAQLPRDLRNAELEEWLQLLAGCTVGSTHTNVEGKYELTLAGGHFVAFASSDSLISTVKWAIPIEVKSAGPVKVDFWNDTAAWIHNKKP